MEERMTRITRYGRKVKTTFISTMFAACIAIVIGIPFVSKNMFNNDVGYYSISIRGTHVGAANTEEEVNVALANARLQLSQQLDDYIYMDCDVQIDKENRAIASRMSEKQLAILRRKLRMRLNSDTQPKHGIGLRNVQDRIHIQFGTEYGLSVYTKEHCYTKVSIHLPITRGKYSPMDQEGDEKEEEKENEYTAGCRR